MQNLITNRADVPDKIKDVINKKTASFDDIKLIQEYFKVTSLFLYFMF